MFQCAKTYTDLQTPGVSLRVDHELEYRVFGIRGRETARIETRIDPSLAEMVLAETTPAAERMVVHGAGPEFEVLSGLFWQVTAARFEQGEAFGYSDRVRILRRPKTLGLRELIWGRAHFPEETVVFNRVSAMDGSQWHRTLIWNRDLPVEIIEAAIEVRFECSERFDERGGMVLSTEGVELTTRQRITLNEGEVVTRERFPRWLTRQCALWATGQAWEERWLSEAVSGGQHGWCVHERVMFK